MALTLCPHSPDHAPGTSGQGEGAFRRAEQRAELLAEGGAALRRQRGRIRTRRRDAALEWLPQVVEVVVARAHVELAGDHVRKPRFPPEILELARRAEAHDAPLVALCGSLGIDKEG